MKDLLEEVIAIRRDIHQHPEIAFDVERTAGIVAQYLENTGIDVKRNIGRTGVVGDIHVPGATKRIALRADMDALPIQEQGNKPYQSQSPGKAHLCGHDAHTAMLLGAAKMLSNMREQLTCHVRFIFQPSEELFPGGAPAMIADGALEEVDAIYALHVWPTLETGVIGVCDGAAMAAPDSFDIMITGVGGHAALPQKTIQSIVVGADVVAAFHEAFPPKEDAVVTVTQFHSGSAYNVIPDRAHITGTVRTFKDSVRHSIREKMEEILKVMSEKKGASYSLEYHEGYPVTYNHDSAVKATTAIIPEVAEKMVFPAVRMLGGEDFAYYAQKIPGCFIQLGCRNEAKNCVYMLHDPRFDLDEECMRYGINLHTRLALEGIQF
ncbi:MAG: amidohydrolase [Chlamydiales bacterium]|nr:amidohydrolase [Chlamydiales bacterium]